MNSMAPMLSVEIGGMVAKRASVPEVLLYDRTGRPVMVRMRPQLLAGEHLVERPGQIPMILQEEECLIA
jgi:hypothetical protein